MNRIPRLYVAAANPPKSEMTPPPMLSRRACLVALCAKRKSQIVWTVVRFLCCSPVGIVSVGICWVRKWRSDRQWRATLSSVRMNNCPAAAGSLQY